MPSRKPGVPRTLKLVLVPSTACSKVPFELQPPPLRANKRFKLLYATQLPDKSSSTIPVPVFLLFVNDPSSLTDPLPQVLGE